MSAIACAVSGIRSVAVLIMTIAVITPVAPVGHGLPGGYPDPRPGAARSGGADDPARATAGSGPQSRGEPSERRDWSCRQTHAPPTGRPRTAPVGRLRRALAGRTRLPAG